MAGCAKRKPIAGLADGGITQPIPGTWIEQRDRQNAINPPAPFQETWVEKRDRENAINPPAPFQETWVEQRDRETAALAPKLAAAPATSRRAAAPVTSMGLPTFQGLGVKRTPMAGIAGLADGGTTGVIPGKVNPKVADDITINAKKGEYILSTDDVALLGGPEAVDAMVKSLREQAGLPTTTGPKTHGQPDSKGRMDKPGLPSKGIAGLANAGLVDPYETDYQKLGNNPLAGFRQMAGIAGNALTNAGLTDQNIQRRVLDQSQPATSATPATAPSRPDMTADQMTAVARSKTPGLNMDTIPAHNPNAPIPISKVSPIAIPKAAPKIAPGMVSIADSVNAVGLPESGTSLSKSAGGASVQLDGNKGLGDTTAISNRVDWSPGSANVRNLEINAKYNDEVKRAGIANAAVQGPKTADQHLLAVQSGNTTWGMNPQQQQAIAGTNFAAQEKGIADTKDVESRRYVADVGLEGHKYAADSALKGQGIAGAAHVESARIAEQGREAKAKAAHGLDQAKDSKEMIKTYYDSIKHLDLPAGYEGRHMELAKDLANAQDPSTDFGIYHAPGSQRQGIATKKSVYEPLLAKYTKAGYPLADAHASAYRDLLTLERQNGVQLHKPFPNLDILRSRNTKPVDPILGAS